MKKVILLAFLASFIFSSCKKEETLKTPSPVKKYSVTFKVNSFTQTVEDIMSKNSAKTSISPSISKLFYLAYDQSGKNVSFKYQSDDDVNFGNIRDSLPAGTYTAIFTGISGSYWGLGGEVTGYVNPYLFAFSGSNVVEDLFLKKTTFTIGDSSVNQSISMGRIIGKMDLIIKDTIPSDICSIMIDFINESNYYYLRQDSTEDDRFRRIGYDISASQSGKPNVKLSAYVVNTNSPQTIVVKGLTKTNKVVSLKEITNVRFYKNKTTVLTGKLFDAPATQGFSVGIADEWDPSEEVVHF